MLGSSHADYHVHVDNATPYGLWPLRGLRDLAAISFMSFCCWVTRCLRSHFRLEPSSSVFLLTRYEWREDLGCESSALHASLIFFFIESSNTRQLDTKRCLYVRSFPFVSSTNMGCLSTLQPGRKCVWFHFKLHNRSELASLVSPRHNLLAFIVKTTLKWKHKCKEFWV